MKKEVRKMPESMSELGKISFIFENIKMLDSDEFINFNNFQLLTMLKKYITYEESLVIYNKYKDIDDEEDLLNELNSNSGGFLEESIMLSKTIRYTTEEIFEQYTDLELVTTIFTNLIIKTYNELVEWIDRMSIIKPENIDLRFSVDVVGIIEIDEYRYLLIRYMDDDHAAGPILIEFDGPIEELKELAKILTI